MQKGMKETDELSCAWCASILKKRKRRRGK
jgi:hypothetical protein